MDAFHGRMPPTPLLPALLVPGSPGEVLSPVVRLAYDDALHHGPLAPQDRLALLSAALERPDCGSSILHAVGATLAVQDARDEPVDLGAAWSSLAQTAKGRALLRATLTLGQGGAVQRDELMAVYRHLQARAPAWQKIMMLSAVLDMAERLQRPFLTPDSDERLLPWLRHLVDARGTLDEVLRSRGRSS